MIGQQLGPYTIEAELGSGGMGTVYRATGPDGTVALKVVHPHLLATPGFFKRFLREAQIGQEVQHENVVRTFDCDATLLDGKQQNFLVMEYVEGQTLRGLLNELERVPEELCRHIGREVAKGLAAIHGAGVLHRDLKPENVLITADHVVKVMDLGVARLQDEAIRLSHAGAFVGSLEYAAPEQFRPADGDPDGRADLHALGVILYELATGRHPYRDEDGSKVIGHILDTEPRRAGEINPQLSPFVEELVHTLIAKDREKRFAAASDLVAILEAGEACDWWQGRARAMRLQTKRPLRRIRIPRETALYGRDDDLAMLQRMFEKAKEGEGQVLLLEGEAGIGKTRLVDEFVGRLRQVGEDVNFLFGSYPPGGAATASGAFSEAYREQFGAEGLEETLAGYIKLTPILIPAFAAVLKGETTPADAEQLTKDSLQTVFVHATQGLAAERTTIVLIDDLHFAPEEGRALFSSLAMAVPGHRILLLGTMRPGMPEDWTANVERLDQARRTVLSRLGPKDLTNLLEDSFHSEKLALELAGQIAVKCDGNPFFTFEIIRGLREGQFISQQPDGTWVTTKLIQNIQVPSSVLDLVNARVADLSEEERDLLDVAACWGFEFDPGLIAAVLGLSPIPALKRFGQIERQHRLVRATGRTMVFDHHQVQEALHASLLEQLREQYHAALADALEIREKAADRDPKDLDGALCVDLCEHFLKGAQGERALRYLRAALSHLRRGHLHGQAIRLADRALAVPGLLEGVQRAEVLLEKNGRLDLFGRRQEQETVLSEAAALAEAAGDAALQANVVLYRGRLLSSMGRYEEAEAEHERAVPVFREVGDRSGEARARMGLSVALRCRGRLEEAQTQDEHALTIFREIGDRWGVAGATANIGNVLFSLGRHEEARAHHERALAINREIGHLPGEAIAMNNLGLALGALGLREEARACYERALDIDREVGDRPGEASSLSNLGMEYGSLGRTDEARAHYERALVICREIGDRSGEAVVLVNLGPLWVGLGARERAQDALEQSLSICREIGARYPQGYALLYLARLRDEEGQVEEARRFAHESLDLRREIGQRDGVVQSLLFLADLERRAGRTEEAHAGLVEALALAREQGSKKEAALAQALLTRLFGGDPAAAEAALEQAGEAGNTSAVRYHLWKATGKPEHLAEAKRLLDFRVEHSPEEYRESMLTDVRLHRDIMKAWEEHGGGE
jgi:tetratricopeptide (TPR) repeat protein